MLQEKKPLGRSCRSQPEPGMTAQEKSSAGVTHRVPRIDASIENQPVESGSKELPLGRFTVEDPP